MKKEQVQVQETKTPSGWFFAEWISILATFMACFVFLFYQNQLQGARSDDLYKNFTDIMKDVQNQRTDSNAKWADLLIKYSEIKCEMKSKEG